MPAFDFGLFGEALALQNGKNTIKAIGGSPVLLTITLDVARATVAVDFDGRVFGLDTKFQVSGPVSIRGQRVRFTGINQPQVKRANLNLSGQSHKIANPSLRIAADTELALEIVDPQGILLNWLRSSLPGDIEPDLTRQGLTYSVDARAKQLVALTVLPGRPFFEQIDEFGVGENGPGNPGNWIGTRQRLNVLRIVYDDGKYQLDLRPASGALFLQADVFDTSRGEGNQILFQYALVNGILRIDGTVTASTATWATDHSLGALPAVLLLRIQDEHGHPVGLELATGNVELTRRPGQRSTVSEDSALDDWETLNEALVIGPRGAGSAQVSIPVRLKQLDPIAIYRAYAEAEDLTGVTAPPFIVNGGAKLSKMPPSELHGLSRGAWLRREASKTKTAIDATLSIQPLLYKAKPYFHFTELQLAEAGEWEVVILREERDLIPDASQGDGAIGAYVLVGRSQEVRLPAIDLSFALSNLTGTTRRGADGERRGQGYLFDKGRDRLLELETQFCTTSATRFNSPKIENQTHHSGMRLEPALQVFRRMLDILPAAADTISDVGRISPELEASTHSKVRGRSSSGAARSTTSLMFGGPPGDTKTAKDQLAPWATDAGNVVGPVLSHFEKAWRALAADPDVKLLREKFSIPDRQLSGVETGRLADYQRAAIDYLVGSRNTDDIANDTYGLLAYLNDIPPDEFGSIWEDSGDAGINLLWEHVWAPADLSLMRRIIRWENNMPPLLKEKLFGTHADLGKLVKYLSGTPANGLIAEMEQGTDSYWDDVVELWKSSSEPEIVLLRQTYGSQLTRDVFEQLLTLENDAEAFAQEIRDQLGIELERLSDLAPEPPEYLLRTRRFKAARQSGASEKLTEALWSQCFDLCGFDTKRWLFFLDAGSSLIVKLSRKRGLDLILREIIANFTAPDRPDPLGLERSLDHFIASLDPDLLEPDWVGAFLIRPVADISQDVVLRDLAGFEHITGSYVAVGGRQQIQPGDASLDVWAHIFKERRADRDLNQPNAPPDDVKLALTKFDVRLRKTRLSSADIEVQIHPKNVLGKRDPNFKVIILRGILEPPAANSNGSPDLTYSAFFPKPVHVPVDLAFINRLELKSLRVARFNNATCIDIDAEMVLQNTKLPIGIDDLEGRKLHLESFRIPIPSVSPIKIELGELRQLAFDLPAASFSLPKARTFNMFGVEVTPTGVGYVRGDGEPFRRIKQDYIWLNRLDLGQEPKGFAMPYLTMSMDFGKLPTLGGGVQGLKFDAILAFKVDNGSTADKAYFGISGLDATDVTIDLFRILSLHADRFAISKAELYPGDGGAKKDAGAILAQNLKLKLFNWSPAPENSRFDLLLLHPFENDHPASRKGMLAFYDAQAAEDEAAAPARLQRRLSTRPGRDSGALAASAATASESFFKVFWILLAHNLALPPKVLNWLLSANPGQDDPNGMLAMLLEKPEDPGDPAKVLKLNGVRLEEDESWLFGISFRLGELFTRCNLVLQDQHYYGIRLHAPWVEKVFDQESIELAYIPGATADQDRFRTNLRIPALDMLGFLKSGETALEWAVNWDFLIDIGFPWRTPNGYDWFRAFSIPLSAYEGKVGFYVEKRAIATQSANLLTLCAGFSFYVGYYFGAGNSVAWVRAGIGVFAILQGSMTFRIPQGADKMLLKSTLHSAEITGVVGVFAYGEGGIDVWILSARFRVSAQASLACTIRYVAGAPCVLTYSANLAAHYSASCRVGSGWCSWTFRVSGQVGMPISGQLLLS